MREPEGEATPESVARAVGDAGAGESTVLACSGPLTVDEALALAGRQRHALGLESEVRIAFGGGRIRIEPALLERRSALDRRVAERRQAAAGPPPGAERRGGGDRRSGQDRRRPVKMGRSAYWRGGAGG